MSYEYKKYIYNYKKRKLIIKAIQLLIIVLVIISWQVLSDNNYINSFITSSPKRIIITIINLIKKKQLWIHIYTTIKECFISFIITSFLSLLISILFYNYKTLYKIFDPYLTILNSLPKVAFGPLLIIWLGANNKSIITMSILISIIISIQTIYNGFESTDKKKLKLLNIYKASKKDILIYLVIPQNKNTIINSLKINISMCLVGVITGEFLTSKAGIGYLILYGSQVFNLDLVMSGIFLLILISCFMYNLINIVIKNRQ